MIPTPVLSKVAQFYMDLRALCSPQRPSIHSFPLRAFPLEGSGLPGKEAEVQRVR